MAGDIGFFMKTHVWVPILVGVGSVVLIVIIGIIALLLFRKYSRYDYTPLLEDLAMPDQLHMERQIERDTVREGALLNCQFYLRSRSGKYSYSDQLPDMGTRLEKHWFLVQYPRQNKDLLLSICSKSPRCPMPFNSSSQKTLRDLLKSVKHPYIWPVQDVEFLEEQDLVVVLQSYSSRGSLRDYIFNVKPNNTWESKINLPSKFIGNKQIQVFGRQILEGLLYLQANGFPNHCHLHAGNVIVDRNCCKLTGMENMFLGYTSKLYPTIRRKLKDSPEAIDVLAFGHVIFEMCSGYELNTAFPDRTHLTKLKNLEIVQADNMIQDVIFEMCSGYELNTAFPDRTHLTKLKNLEIVQILEFIFDANGSYPTLQEIAGHDFFSDVKLPELMKSPPSEIIMNSSMKSLVKSIKKGKSLKSQSSRRSSSSKNIGKSKKESKDGRSRSKSIPSSHLPEKSIFQQPPPSTYAPVVPPLLDVEFVPPPSQPPTVPDGRKALFGDIIKGVTLKKTATDDRSALRV